MKLHYSQTSDLPANAISVFYYLMKLHYSQTVDDFGYDIYEFYYLMKLHYSQTNVVSGTVATAVLLPYEITLFSNPV